MTSPRSEDLEQRLRALRETQARLAAEDPADGARVRSVGREIEAVAGRLGFDPDEAAAIADQIDAPGSGAAMAGDYRVLRGVAEPILTFCALVIAGAVTGLGQPVAGGAIVVAALASWFIRGARRVARLHIDASGSIGFPGRLDRLEPSGLVGIDFVYRYPFGVSGYRKAAGETVDLRFHLGAGRSIRLARGALWRTSPRREPVAWRQLERFLSARARDAGLKVEQGDAGWTARRP